MTSKEEFLKKIDINLIEEKARDYFLAAINSAYETGKLEGMKEIIKLNN